MTTCATWCGAVTNWEGDEPCDGKGCFPLEDKLYKRDTCFCSTACRDAGKPLHPVSKPPGEPTCTCWKDFSDHGVPFMRHDSCAVHGTESAPGSALPLPGPPARESKRPINAVVCVDCGHRWEPTGGAGGQTMPTCPVCALRRDLAEARTALAEAQAAFAKQNTTVVAVIDQRDDARARLAVTVGALGRIAAEECAWTGSYVDCAEAAENPREEFTGACPACIARAALAPTGAPVQIAKEPA